MRQAEQKKQWKEREIVELLKISNWLGCQEKQWSKYEMTVKGVQHRHNLFSDLITMAAAQLTRDMRMPMSIMSLYK